jgi:addiction module HigA family antidote
LIETIRHKGLRRLYEKNDRSGIRPDLVEKVQKILSALEAANGPEDMALPMFRFHSLTGDLIRDCLDELGVTVTDGAKALGVTRAALSRLINRKAGVSAEMAVRLEKAIGSTAGFWLRLQLNYDLAQIQARSGKIHARRLGIPAQLAL